MDANYFYERIKMLDQRRSTLLSQQEKLTSDLATINSELAKCVGAREEMINVISTLSREAEMANEQGEPEPPVEGSEPECADENETEEPNDE